MHSRKAKNWCRTCKEEARVETQRRQQEEADRQQANYFRQQQNLFQQARMTTDQDTDVDPRRDRERALLHNIMIVQMQQQGRNPLEDETFQRQITDLFLEVDLETAR